jgi:hypothetical protein
MFLPQDRKECNCSELLDPTGGKIVSCSLPYMAVNSVTICRSIFVHIAHVFDVILGAFPLSSQKLPYAGGLCILVNMCTSVLSFVISAVSSPVVFT